MLHSTRKGCISTQKKKVQEKDVLAPKKKKKSTREGCISKVFSN